jgi:UDP-2,3-diacylglucosamine hydrolase
MGDKVYFISDLHLGSDKEPNAFVLIKFLKSFQSTEQITHLFLLGDIFDLWVANHSYFKNKYKDVLRELIRLRALGVKIHYFEGNHDLYLKPYFQKELGFEVHTGPRHMKLLNMSVRIEHGDQMDPTDRGYRFLRWFLRTPAMKWLAPRLPEWFVVWLGETMSRASRKYTSQLKTITIDRAKNIIRYHGQSVKMKYAEVELLISGHVHVVEDLKLPSGIRCVNLGAWFDHPRTFLLSNEFIGFQRLSK